MKAMTPIQMHLVCDIDHVRRAAVVLDQAPALGLDTEFVRERTWFPRPGLLQISDGREAWLFDPIALEGEPEFRDWLAGLLGGPAVKILHSVGEDFEVLELLSGVRPWPLFDTQRAAALLGWPLQMQLEKLAAVLLAVDLPGGLGRNDWTRRPLPEAWLRYAADDVIVLKAMHDELRQRLLARGRLEWLEEDCRRMIERKDTDSPAVTRVKGAAGLDDEALERLSRLADWRDETARERDLPRSFVARDEVLVALARQPAAFDQAGVPKRHRAALQRLLDEPASAFARPAELTVLDGAQRSRIKALQAGVRDLARELEVEPAVLASRRDLTRWVQGCECDWLHGWRGNVMAPLLNAASPDRG